MAYILISTIIVVSVITVLSISAEESLIPLWIKNTAGWWANEQINESEFLNAIQFLIQNEIISISDSIHNEIQNNSSNDSVPSWVKNNARWWSEGQIGDNDFITGIEFLVKNGMIHVGTSQNDGLKFNIDNLLPTKISLEEIISKNISYKKIANHEDDKCIESVGIDYSHETTDNVRIVYSTGICKLRNVEAENDVFDSREFPVMGESQKTGRCFATPLGGDYELQSSNVFCLIDDYLFGTVAFFEYNSADFRTLLSIEETIIKNYHKQKYGNPVDISLSDILKSGQSSSKPNEGGIKAEEGFSSLSCRQDEYGFIKMTGRFTNGADFYSTIYFTLGIEDKNGNIVATGIGTLSNVEPYQTRIFDATAEWDGPYVNCLIEVNDAFP